jgi:hypothetical protein
MKSTRMPLPAGLSVWWLLGAVLWLSASAWGQTAPSEETPALRPAVTVQHQGRLLVLSYKLMDANDQPCTQSVSSSRPTFTIHKGNRKIASGQFQYG